MFHEDQKTKLHNDEVRGDIFTATTHALKTS